MLGASMSYEFLYLYCCLALSHIMPKRYAETLQRLPAVWCPSSPSKAGKGQYAYFSIPRWEQDAYSLKAEHDMRERKKHAANIKQGPFYTDGETKAYATRKINTAVPPRPPRLYDPWLQ